MIDDYVHPLSINGQLMKKDARIAELKAALKPFAEWETFTAADIRAARAALEKKE